MVRRSASVVNDSIWRASTFRDSFFMICSERGEERTGGWQNIGFDTDNDKLGRAKWAKLYLANGIQPICVRVPQWNDSPRQGRGGQGELLDRARPPEGADTVRTRWSGSGVGGIMIRRRLRRKPAPGTLFRTSPARPPGPARETSPPHAHSNLPSTALTGSRRIFPCV